jgi:hypothetical protein
MRKETGYYKSNVEKFSFCPGMELMAEILAVHRQKSEFAENIGFPGLLPI